MRKDSPGESSLEHISEEISELIGSVWDGVASVITSRLSMDSFLRLIPVKGVGSLS